MKIFRLDEKFLAAFRVKILSQWSFVELQSPLFDLPMVRDKWQIVRESKNEKRVGHRERKRERERARENRKEKERKNKVCTLFLICTFARLTTRKLCAYCIKLRSYSTRIRSYAFGQFRNPDTFVRNPIVLFLFYQINRWDIEKREKEIFV